MRCDFCAYEFTMKEIQSGDECPKCTASKREDEARKQAAAARLAVSPVVQEVASKYPGAQPVVVVDLRMGFFSIMWFMVKAAIASIPAFIIVFVIVSVLSAVFGGFFLGLLGAMAK